MLVVERDATETFDSAAVPLQYCICTSVMCHCDVHAWVCHILAINKRYLSHVVPHQLIILMKVKLNQGHLFVLICAFSIMIGVVCSIIEALWSPPHPQTMQFNFIHLFSAINYWHCLKASHRAHGLKVAKTGKLSVYRFALQRPVQLALIETSLLDMYGDVWNQLAWYVWWRCAVRAVPHFCGILTWSSKRRSE